MILLPRSRLAPPSSPPPNPPSFDGGDEKITAIMELMLAVMLTLSLMRTELPLVDGRAHEWLRNNTWPLPQNLTFFSPLVLAILET
ncbi:hypothetical protein OPV22_007421 [Ensete ventricosum]|uniref:Uncharacterized protein n=1 Tax=Ensete ventricosum TaxID=4639 RepID=A0AAV8RUQ7_ENSVE|nr:hypothetical protein OPV22_007421 [Ensete ventricosum]